MKKRRRRKSGQVVIEFLCVLGLYFFLIGFMLSGFQLMHSKMIADVSAFTGARYACASVSKNTAESAAKEILTLNAFNNTDTTNISFSYSDDNTYVTCTVQSNISLLFPIINPNLVGDSITSDKIQTQFTMRVEK